jgi:hypothetical protein
VFATLPSYVMALIAVAVPVVVVTAASAAYFQLGRDAQFEMLYSQAQQIAQQAAQQPDLPARRTGLEAALGMLYQAETYRLTPETQALRLQIRTALDDLDLIRRVSYEPAIIGGLPTAVNVTRIFLSDRDLYLLDGNSGSIFRATLKGQVYELDPAFQCEPGQAGAGVGSPLIDAAAWPADYVPQASLVAVNGQGGIVYCRPGEPPTPGELAAPPSEAWGSIAGVALDGDFYVLDYASNMVWIYQRSTLEEEPVQFFDQEIPILQDVNDLAVNKNDLYLLHQDGRMTLCLYGNVGVSPTRCSDPAYMDYRPGRENLPLSPPAPFTQIQVTSPPDPSLFLLEPVSQSIYHFSLRNLAFQRQFLPENPLPAREATAFAVDTIQRNLFIALGNEIYYAIMP